MLLRRTVLPWRGVGALGPVSSTGHRKGGRGERGGVGGGGSPNEWGTANGEGGVRMLLKRAVLLWRGWVLWAPCQARGIGRGWGDVSGGWWRVYHRFGRSGWSRCQL